MDHEQGFYTLKGYDMQSTSNISAAMEDYLEMICRYYIETDQHIRVNVLANKLNVTPPSASKMVYKLKEQNLVSFEPYGQVILTDEGKVIGEYLLKRHDVLHQWLCYINNSTNELEQVEKIEHFLNQETILNLEKKLHLIQGRERKQQES